MKKNVSLTELAYSYQNQDHIATQAGSLDQLNRTSVPFMSHRYQNSIQKSQIIMFMDSNESVETNHIKAPYSSKVHKDMEE